MGKKGFDLSEMILGRQAKPMEVEEREEEPEPTFDWSKFDDRIPEESN